MLVQVNSVCKLCKKEYHKEYNKNYSKRPEVKERQKEYKKDHFEQSRISRRKHYRNNPDVYKNQRLKKTYGITLDQYNQILKDQNGVCAICGQPETLFDKRVNKVRSLAVDHDHKTGKVRGLLCSKHNKILGVVEDNIEMLQNHIDYLKNHART